MKTYWYLSSLLFLVGCVGSADSESYDDELSPADNDSASQVVDGESEEGYVESVEGGLEQSMFPNDAPCGDNTIAIVETEDRNARYIFCAAEGDGTGVLEVLAQGYESLTVLTELQRDPVALLTDLVGELPDDVRSALQGEEPPGVDGILRVSIPLERLIERADVAWPPTVSSTAQCNSNHEWSEFFVGEAHTSDSGSSGAFYSSEVNCTGGTHDGISWCHHGIKRFLNTSSLVGFSQRTASSSYSGGACAAYGTVRSCGGSTLFKAEQRAGTSGSWPSTPSLSYWISSGGRATWYMFASNKRCQKGQDKDDFRYRADSESGAGHRYGYMFVKEMRNTGGCVACTSN